MRTHDHEQVETDDLRPKSSRLDERDTSLLLRAGAAGRTDVLGPEGLLQMQRLVGNGNVQRVAEDERSPVLDVISSGGGRSLDEPVRADMEARLGHDFSDVKIHTDDAAHHSAASVNAHAYTVGSDIVFQRDRFDPSSTAGRTTLAHELTHVVQQSSGPVDGTPTGTGVSVSDPSDRFEREAAATAERAMAGPATVQSMTSRTSDMEVSHATLDAHASTSSSVQRDDEEAAPEEDDGTVQASFVQRLEEDEDVS